ALVLLGGGAGLTTLPAEGSSFGEGPAGRSPGSSAFARLPPPPARAAETEALEASARGALARAGFSPVAAGGTPDVLVQVGTRVGRSEPPWADPFWWRGGFGAWRYNPWAGPRWGYSAQFDLSARFEREVALLIRDRASGKPLFEARASHESVSSTASAPTLAAMFAAALTDFPKLGLNPRRVSVPMPAETAR
ncbi:MAG: DUF4136 domain-containing protein, partial [Betaproteobacteria bacterium]